MAERVGRGIPGGSTLVARARRLPAPVWFVLLVAGGLVVAILVAVLRHDSDPLRAEVSQVPRQSDPAHFTFSYQVTKNPLAIADCVFQIEDGDHAVIATTTQRAEPTDSNDRTSTHTVTVDTPHQGVTAELQRCQLQRK